MRLDNTLLSNIEEQRELLAKVISNGSEQNKHQHYWCTIFKFKSINLSNIIKHKANKRKNH